MNFKSALNAVIVVAAIELLTINIGHAQGASTYDFEAISGTFTNVTGGTSLSSIQGDDYTSGSIPIGFTFNFCGIDYTNIVAGSNGIISFNSSNTYLTLSNSTTSFSTVKPALMPLWDDLNGNSGTASYVVTGTAPNRVFTLECKNWKWNYSSSVCISFQVKLYETTNIIEYVYRQETGSTNLTSASIGILDGASTPGFLVLNTSGTAPTTSTTNFVVNISSRPATGQIYRFIPIPALDMKVDTLTIAQNTCSKDSSMISCQIKNLGTATIDTVQVNWSVDGVLQTPVLYAGTPITNFTTAPNNIANVDLGKVYFDNNNTKSIVAWTSMPNSLPDMASTNDTFTASLAPTYEGLTVSISPQDTTICEGSSVILDAGNQAAGDIFIWSNGAVTQQTAISQAGSYNVIVQSAEGCFAYDTVTVTVNPLPIAGTFGVVDIGGSNFQFTPSGMQYVTNYHWNFGDGNSLNASYPVMEGHHYAQSGTYAVSLTVSNSCDSVTLNKQVFVQPTTGINELTGQEGFIRVFPNPAANQVTIQAKGERKLERVEVYNLLGQQIRKVNINKSDKYSLDVTGFASGMYNLVIYTDKGQAVRKLNVFK